MPSCPSAYETEASGETLGGVSGKELGEALGEEQAEDLQIEDPFPRERIAALKPWCTAPAGSGCSRCAVVCPHGAITLEGDGPLIDETACTRCGLCAGVCDAFAWERMTLADLAERCVREAAEEGSVCFTCNDQLFPGVAPRGNVVILPCLAVVPPEFWSFLMAQGVPVSVYRDASYCNACPTAGSLAAPLFAHALSAAQEWTGGAVRFVEAVPERETFLAALGNIDESDRRSILSHFASEGIDVATGKYRRRNAGVVDDFHERRERMRAMGRIKSAAPVAGPPALNQRQRPRQELAVRAACALPAKAGQWVRYSAVTDAGACKGIGCCVDACPTGARTMESGVPHIDAARCIACGVCIAACPAGACDFQEITAEEYLG